MKLKLSIIFLAIFPLSLIAEPLTKPTINGTQKQIKSTKLVTTSQSKNWYQNLFFKNSHMTYEFVRGIGYTYTQGADIGESINTALKIHPETIDNWYAAWLKTANQTYLHGQKFYSEGDLVSARHAFMRASNYYRMASFYMDAPDQKAKATSTWKMSRKSFMLAIQSLPYIKSIIIPYESTTLHGYFMHSPKKSAPLVILNTGFDGTAEELYFEAGKLAYQHGYNVLFFDGPGQGQSIKLQNIPFRPDWEKVIGPVIDFAQKNLKLKSKKIALIGFNFGGYLSARACAFLPKISACVLDPGTDNLLAGVLAQLPPNTESLVNTDPQELDKIITKAMQKNLSLNWFINNGMWTFNAKTPAEFIKMASNYQLDNVINKIKMPTLVIRNSADIFQDNQAREVFDSLTGPKTFFIFSPKSTAQAHCQMGAMAISNEVIFNWLNKTLDYFPNQAELKMVKLDNL